MEETVKYKMVRFLSVSVYMLFQFIFKNMSQTIVHIFVISYEPRNEKIYFAYAKIKAQITCAVTMQLISAFGFATYSQYKKKRKLLRDIFWGVAIIDCKYNSISVALPFNEELYSEVLS